MTKMLRHFGYGIKARLAICHIDREGHDSIFSQTQTLFDFCQTLLVGCNQTQFGTFCRISLRNGKADAPTCPCDDGNLIF